jgi:hypothetical protein
MHQFLDAFGEILASHGLHNNRWIMKLMRTLPRLTVRRREPLR